MIIELTTQDSFNKALSHLSGLFKRNKTIELKEVVKTRTSSQNRSLHLYFTMIADQFNEIGISFNYHCPFTGRIIELTWTGELVKEYIWRPIQKEIFDKESTTKIDTNEINQIIEILSKHFAESGVEVKFPCWKRFLNEMDKKNF